MLNSARFVQRLLLLLSLVAAPSSAVVSAQSARTPDAVLETGFTPDPVLLSGRAVASHPLSRRASACTGFAGSAPDHVVRLAGPFRFFRLFLVTAHDLTLAVHAPDGTWRCATAHGERPALQEGALAAGDYEIWIGSPTRGVQAGYELRLTEFRSVSPSDLDSVGDGSSIDVGLSVDAEEGSDRGRRIRRGFLPDPIRDGATAGGDIDVRLLGAECRGFVSAIPNHVMTLRNEFDYLRIQLGGASGQATIVLRTPAGRYLCSAPEDSNAFVDQDVWPEGVYRIWVGSLQPAEHPHYSICYTEARLSEATATCAEVAPDT